MIRKLLAIGSTMSWTAVLSGCNYESASRRFEMTVQIEESDKTSNGSTIIEIGAVVRRLNFPSPARSYTTLKGEAIDVKLSNGKVAFVLLAPTASGHTLADEIVRSYWRNLPRDVSDYAVRPLNDIRPGECKSLNRSQIPLVVAFEDIKDPESVYAIGGGPLKDSHGVSLTAQVCETSKPLSSGIGAILPWLDRLNGLSLDGSKYNEAPTI